MTSLRAYGPTFFFDEGNWLGHEGFGVRHWDLDMINEGDCEYEVEEMVHIVSSTINITPHPSLLIFKSRIHSLTSV